VSVTLAVVIPPSLFHPCKHRLIFVLRETDRQTQTEKDTDKDRRSERYVGMYVLEPYDFYSIAIVISGHFKRNCGKNSQWEAS